LHDRITPLNYLPTHSLAVSRVRANSQCDRARPDPHSSWCTRDECIRQAFAGRPGAFVLHGFGGVAAMFARQRIALTCKRFLGCIAGW